jgi:GNAT superfamily N-acetyltransferase
LQIVDYNEVRAEWETQVQLLDASAGWYPMDFKRVNGARKAGYPAADYWGVYAVENGRVLSTVRVVRIPFTMDDGAEETVSAIQGVVTRREHSGRGLAKKLLAEVHRREEGAGNRLSILWTGHGNVAHNLYTSIGYVDVYTPKLAMKRLGLRKGKGGGYAVRPARMADAELIERIHAEATRGRVGFTPRPKGSLGAQFILGFVRPNSLRLVLSGREPVGYFQVQKGIGWARSDEVVIKPGVDPEEILSALESEAGGSWLTVLGTFVRDSASLLRGRGYSFTDHSYFGLLARPLVKSRLEVRKKMGVDCASFTCHFLDYF